MMNTAEWPDTGDFVLEALENFAVLIDDLDFDAFYELMGIGRFQFLRRKQMLVELKGLHMALWRLALSKSFPNDANAMFATFLHDYASTHVSRLDRQVVERAQQYWGMIMPKDDMDFNDIARHLMSFSTRGQDNARAFSLKLALRVHAAYSFIFDRLI